MPEPSCSALAVVALGSNLGDRLATLGSARARLSDFGRELGCSSIYETPPVGPPQPNYLNAVVLLETALTPERLLETLLAIERAHGRERRERWGPRTLDLDLVAMGDERRQTPTLTLPHPEAHRRAFVLVPLAEVAPDLLLPGVGSAAALRDRLDPDARGSVVRVADTWPPLVPTAPSPRPA